MPRIGYTYWECRICNEEVRAYTDLGSEDDILISLYEALTKHLLNEHSEILRPLVLALFIDQEKFFEQLNASYGEEKGEEREIRENRMVLKPVVLDASYGQEKEEVEVEEYTGPCSKDQFGCYNKGKHPHECPYKESMNKRNSDYLPPELCNCCEEHEDMCSDSIAGY